VLVLGMHRSGTSALAGALGHLGVALGERLLPATAFNPRGYFEHEDVFQLHEEVLYALGRTWDDVRPLPDGWAQWEALVPLRARLRSLLERDFAGVPLWGVKDPRLCRLWPFWQPVLRAMRVTPAFVVIARAPREVARSLAARDGTPDWKSHLLYLHHTLEAERATRGHARAVLTFEQLLADPSVELHRVARAVGLPWPQPLPAGLAPFLSRALRHQRAGAGRPVSEVARRAEECYRALQAGARGRDAGMRRSLDRLARAVTSVAVPWRSLADETARHADRVRAERDGSQGAVQALSAQMAALRVQIDARNSEIDAARLAHEARDAVEGELRKAMQAREDDLDRARVSIASLAEQIDAARRAHEARDRVETELRRALESQQTAWDATRAELEQARAEAVAARGERDATCGERDAARAEIAALVAAVEAARQARAAQQEVETGLRAALEARGGELAVLRAAREADEAAWKAEAAQRDAALSELHGTVGRQAESLAQIGRELEDAHRQIADLRRESAEARAELEWSLAEAEQELAGETWAVQELASSPMFGLAARFWRKLRELPTAGAAPADGAVQSGLDPLPREREAGDCVVTGWAMGAGQVRLRRIVLRVGARLVEAERGIARADVAGAHPEAPDAGSSGFRARMRLSPGVHRLAIKAEDHEGRWHLLAAPEVRVRPRRLRAALDRPRERWLPVGPVRLAGWCCHPDEAIRRVTIVFGRTVVECVHGLQRDDVAAVHPDHPGSGASGFEVTCPLPAGRGRLRLRAELASGHTVVHTFDDLFTVVPAAPGVPAAAAARAAESAARWGRLGQHLWRRFRVGAPLPPARHLPARLREAVRRHHAREQGVVPPARATAPPHHPATDAYTCFMRVNASNARADAVLARRVAQAGDRAARVSVLLAAPAGGDEVEALLTRLRAQRHGEWELCVAVDAGEPQACARLRALRAGEPRLHVTCGDHGSGRARAVNAASALATGDVVVALAGTAVPAPELVAELALAFADPATDVAYWDHDLLDEHGGRANPSLKPGWSPERLLSTPYVGRAWAARRAVFTALAGLSEEASGAEDYDFLLRAAERACRVVHVPLVLHHERPGRAADAPEPAREALSRALVRRGWEARPALVDAEGTPVFALEFPHGGPRVAVIRQGQADAPRAPSPLAGTLYRDHVLVEAPAAEPLADVVSRLDVDYLLFLADGVEPRDPAWLSRMVGYARVPGVGAVGARLIAPGGEEEVGLTTGSDAGRIGPAVLHRAQDGGPADARIATDRWAVGGGCLLTPRALFTRMGGFAQDLADPRFREMDYCRRIAAAGERSVYVPVALARADAAAPAPREEAAFRRRHPFREDEFRSPYLAPAGGRLRLVPRRLARGLDRPVRALMCSFNLNREGSAWSQYELTSFLADQGVIEPTVFCPEEGPLRAAYAARGIEVRVAPHPLAGVFEEEAYERAIASFADLVNEVGADVVYANTAHSFYAVAAAERAGVASVWNPRESEPPEQHFRHFGPAVAARAFDCFRLPYRVVFVAEATRHVYGFLETAHNFTVVHNGLDRARLEREGARWTRETARCSLGVHEDEVVILVLGTVCERKGQADLPEALGALPERLWPRVRCLVVGDRGLPYSRRVEAARAGLPSALRERVALLPETDEPARFYRGSDVFVCTSRVESFPRVTLEAMAHGLPLVTTPAFGIREQVREGVNALFYAPGDTGALGAALARLVDDDGLRGRMAEQARPVLECLNDFEAMAGAYGEILREASLAKGRPLPAEPGGAR
jgi:glycosyltransferase involved in cell wall biosynthesis